MWVVVRLLLLLLLLLLQLLLLLPRLPLLLPQSPLMPLLRPLLHLLLPPLLLLLLPLPLLPLFVCVSVSIEYVCSQLVIRQWLYHYWFCVFSCVLLMIWLFVFMLC